MFKKFNPGLPALLFKLIFRSLLLPGIFIGILAIFASLYLLKYTSENQFCEKCHIHPHATKSWKQSPHYKNKSGIQVNCVACHLPPKGFAYLAEKVKVGVRDVWGTLFKDPDTFDWEAKSKLEYAKTYTYDVACQNCHTELFGENLSEKGTDAHVYYFHEHEKIRCINCHLHVGHFKAGSKASFEIAKKEPAKKKKKVRILKPSSPGAFEDYTEIIPETEIMFEMVAIPGGTFKMGSPESESYRQADESPVREVKINQFWMGRTEVTWDEWDEFFLQTGATKSRAISDSKIDAVSGPTPPYGTPDQGWGKGPHPAITMTFHAAQKYCEWLSRKTGNKYRLPTEAEWEYACRGGTSGPYFFEGDPASYTNKSWYNNWFGADTSIIGQYVWYQANSSYKTHPVFTKKPNPFGLYNMLGNVREFCSDWYAPDAYSSNNSGVQINNPTGPVSGKEFVVRGGSYRSDAVELRLAFRGQSRTKDWYLTDPQSPKSIWWYSDCFDVGFRVVREYTKNNSVKNLPQASSDK